MEEAIKSCTLPERVDFDKVNDLLYDVRLKYYFNE